MRLDMSCDELTSYALDLPGVSTHGLSLAGIYNKVAESDCIFDPFEYLRDDKPGLVVEK
jgi:hypothetical protein